MRSRINMLQIRSLEQKNLMLLLVNIVINQLRFGVIDFMF
jgi:hypothetical protein